MDIFSAFIAGLRNFFNPAITIVLGFFNPVNSIFVASFSIVAWLLGAIQNPSGFLNGIICAVIDAVASILPSTPSTLKVGYLLDVASSSMPAIGRSVLSEVFITITAIFLLVAAVKLYKLIPFKAT